MFIYKYSEKQEKLLFQLQTWLSKPELEALVKGFGRKIPSSLGIEERIEWLVNFSEIWDYRRRQTMANSESAEERARWLVRDNNLSEEQIELTMKAAETLGLIGSSIPTQQNYDYILVLGGARMSCLFRMKYAGELCRCGGIKVEKIAGLTGFRTVLESEREAANIYAPKAITEFDLMRAALTKVFNPILIDSKQEVLQDTNSSWAVEEYKGERTFSLIAAPSTEPEYRRANTSDTFIFWQNQERIGRRKRILLITSQIYVPYQQMEAIRVLGIPYEHELETVGFPREWSNGMQGLQKPENYLQEIRSTLLSIRKLLGENRG